MKICVIVVAWFCQTLLISSTVTAQDCIGNCISILQCPSLNSLLLQIQAGRGPSNGLRTLRKAVCANSNGCTRVCCPKINNPHPQTTRRPRLPPGKCGVNFFQTDRIVNGVNAQFAQWPWMVIFRASMRQSISSGSCRDSNPSCSGWAARGECQRNGAFMNANCKSACNKCPSVTGRSNWICGGVLVTAQYVLSAANCFKDNLEIEYARIGEYDLSRNPDKGHGRTAPRPQDIDVERVIRHPSYGSPCSKCNDIALVKLVKPAQLHEFFVVPICLPSNPEQDMGFSAASFQNQLGWATGWGVTNAGDIFSSRRTDILQQVNLTIQETEFCHEQKKSYPDGRMILCAGQGDGRGICKGDEGGPLMLSDQFTQRWYAVGIASSFGGTVCGDPSAQDIFTSVHYYVDWINQNIQ